MVKIMLPILAMLTVDDPIAADVCLSALPWQLNQLEGWTLAWDKTHLGTTHI